MKKLFLSLFVLAGLSVLFGSDAFCAQKDPNVLEIESKFGLHVLGQESREDAVLPNDLGPLPWGLIAIESKNAGYDLTPYAGSKVVIVSYKIKERYHFERLSLHLIFSGDKLIGGYISVGKNSQLVPGVFALNYPFKQDRK